MHSSRNTPGKVARFRFLANGRTQMRCQSLAISTAPGRQACSAAPAPENALPLSSTTPPPILTDLLFRNPCPAGPGTPRLRRLTSCWDFHIPTPRSVNQETRVENQDIWPRIDLRWMKIFTRSLRSLSKVPREGKKCCDSFLYAWLHPVLYELDQCHSLELTG